MKIIKRNKNLQNKRKLLMMMSKKKLLVLMIQEYHLNKVSLLKQIELFI